ncbi:MAG: hypothetical protein EXQ56_10085 [Acidobacteria bacterium]|nr:hypothetical protein [Acidobacteriota bacterium]
MPLQKLWLRCWCFRQQLERLDDHLELLRCHYNFLRPHRALKFGPETRTPAMQAGLATKRLTFLEVFLSVSIFLRLTLIIFPITGKRKSQPWKISPLSLAA